jgi:hypothetical protein
VLRLLGGGDFEALLFGEGDLEALRLTGGGDFEVPLLFAGGVMDRAVYLKILLSHRKYNAYKYI